jgi:F-type H+-transporting ATPase subunit epsilon
MKYRLLSPAGLVCEGTATEVVLPGIDGEVGVLPEHTHYVGLLGVGILRISTSGQDEKFVISGGFATIRNNVLEILADSVDDLSVLPLLKAEESSLREIIQNSVVDSPEWISANTKLKRIAALEEYGNV